MEEIKPINPNGGKDKDPQKTGRGFFKTGYFYGLKSSKQEKNDFINEVKKRIKEDKDACGKDKEDFDKRIKEFETSAKTLMDDFFKRHGQGLEWLHDATRQLTVMVDIISSSDLTPEKKNEFVSSITELTSGSIKNLTKQLGEISDKLKEIIDIMLSKEYVQRINSKYEGYVDSLIEGERNIQDIEKGYAEGESIKLLLDVKRPPAPPTPPTPPSLGAPTNPGGE